jgi:hypothetical protein
MNKTITALITALFLVFTISTASALLVSSVNAPTFTPGQEAQIIIEIENNLNDEAKDVSLTLELATVPFVSIGGSQEFIDEINEDKDEDFTFRLKAANNIAPGDYSIPYIIDFEFDNERQSRSGTIGITVSGKTELGYTISTDNPIIGQKGKITLRIINKEFGEAKFVLVKVLPNGFTLLSDEEVYIGEIESDDFETATFDVIFRSSKPIFTARIEYKDFSNKNIVETVNLPMKIYSRQEAIELGIISESNTTLYIGLAITVILLYILYRTLRKRARLKRSQMQSGRQ